MVNCSYEEIDECQFFSNVVAAKRAKFRNALTPITNAIQEAYDLYLNDFPGLCAKQESDFDDDFIKEALQKCYSIETQLFTAFKIGLAERQPIAIKALCPYCMLNSPDTLDHYVGQTAFPEYSILTKNLIPCCWKCNHSKGEDWRHLGIRRYINYYTDTFLNLPFLTSALLWQGGNTAPDINYGLRQVPGLSNEQFDLIQSHFYCLGLIPKYKLRANAKLSTEIELCKELIDDGWDNNSITIPLMSRFNALTGRYGANYWEAHIYKVVAESIDDIRAM